MKTNHIGVDRHRFNEWSITYPDDRQVLVLCMRWTSTDAFVEKYRNNVARNFQEESQTIGKEILCIVEKIRSIPPIIREA